MLKLRAVLLNSKAAIDLASIMVGVIVIGLIGGVIAATVFAIIPWAQDNAAKQQLEAIHTAQNAAFGLSSDPSHELPAGQERNSFTDSQGLEQQTLLAQGKTYCTVNQGKDDYLAYAKSGSGETFIASNKNRQATPLIGTVAPGCSDIIGENDSAEEPSNPNPPVVDEPDITAPPIYGTTTSFTYKCDRARTDVKPPVHGATGTLTWMNKDTGEVLGSPQTLSNSTPTAVSLAAGVEYQVVLDGTFTHLRNTAGPTLNISSPSGVCLRSMDEWNENTGTQSAAYGFADSINLISVPAQLPSSVTDVSRLFIGPETGSRSKFNDPAVVGWDTSAITNMTAMFLGAGEFNQPVEQWNMSGVLTLDSMFAATQKFNQPIENWKLNSNVTSLRMLFNSAESFNQPMNNMDVSHIQNFDAVFSGTAQFNQPLNEWDMKKATSISNMFRGTVVFNQDINGWDVSNVTTMSQTFYQSKAFNQPLNGWKVSKVTTMQNMFRDSQSFNQPLNEWKTSAVTNMSAMFYNSKAFNQNISGWDVTKVTSWSTFAGQSVLTSSNVPAKFR